MPEQFQEFDIWRYDDGASASVSDDVANEEPLQITVDGTPVAVVMRLSLIHI